MGNPIYRLKIIESKYKSINVPMGGVVNLEIEDHGLFAIKAFAGKGHRITEFNKERVYGPEIDLFGNPERFSSYDVNNLATFMPFRNIISIDEDIWYRNIPGTLPTKNSTNRYKEIKDKEYETYDFRTISKLGRLVAFSVVKIPKAYSLVEDFQIHSSKNGNNGNGIVITAPKSLEDIALKLRSERR